MKSLTKIRTLDKLTFENTLKYMMIDDENVTNLKDYAIISINDRKDMSFFKRNHNNVLNLHFYDITLEQSKKLHKKYKPFSKKQAKMVREFIERNRDKKYWIVHCHAGVSRSGAITTYISRHIKMDHNDFIENNMHILPNQYVLKLLGE